MFRKIMVPYDESPEAGRVLDAAIDLAKMLQAELSVVTVLEPLPVDFSFATSAPPTVHWTEEKRATCHALQAKARQRAKVAGLGSDAELISGAEVGSIIECAEKHHADLLVLRHRAFEEPMALTLILVFSKSPSLLRKRSLLLHSVGYLVVSAFSLGEAVERFHAEDFDLVLVCHSVPVTERESLVRAIRASGSRTPVVSIAETPEHQEVDWAPATVTEDDLAGARANLGDIISGAVRKLPEMMTPAERSNAKDPHLESSRLLRAS